MKAQTRITPHRFDVKEGRLRAMLHNHSAFCRVRVDADGTPYIIAWMWSKMKVPVQIPTWATVEGREIIVNAERRIQENAKP